MYSFIVFLVSFSFFLLVLVQHRLYYESFFVKPIIELETSFIGIE